MAEDSKAADAMRAAHQYIFSMGWQDDAEWKRAQAICGMLTQAIYALPPEPDLVTAAREALEWIDEIFILDSKDAESAAMADRLRTALNRGGEESAGRNPKVNPILDECTDHILAMYELDANGGCDWSAPEYLQQMLDHALAVVEAIQQYRTSAHADKA